jgi:putative flavoprotein involved in K+ transport
MPWVLRPMRPWTIPTKLRSMNHVHTIVIGGGQAGLSVGYYLAQRGIPFEILDASPQIGDAWRNRWDSLRLFTPARYDGLPGLPFPARGDVFPTKNEVADYLMSYARHFDLPVRSGVRVDRLSKEGGRFVVIAGNRKIEADNVVVAMANYQTPRLPAFAGELKQEIVQLHSQQYRNASQLRDGALQVVGVGNSGAEIALDCARSHPTWLSGKESGHIPWRIDTFLARHLLVRVIRFLGHHVLSVKTPMGRKARPKMVGRPAPLVRVKPVDLTNAGITRVARVAGIKDGLPLLEDGSTLDVKNVIWCTGYQPGFSWIDLPVFDAQGKPAHEEGIVKNVPGMYFVGLHFMYAMSSATLIGVSRDAERIANALASRSSRRAGSDKAVAVGVGGGRGA